MPLTQPTLEAQLVLIQTAITAALTDPRPNWRVGQVTLDQQDYLDSLFKQQKNLIEEIKKIPVEDISTSQNWITPFGHDVTDYKNEANF